MLGLLPKILDPNVLVDSSNSDDAGVYRISDELAVVFTADFFTPIVDDPYQFGAIAAANSLSDIYAMGAKPVVALNIAALPGSSDYFDTNRRIMQGGIDKMVEAGVSIIGGHTIKDKEPKYGYAVLGLVHPKKILDNTKAQPGDALILTKPIGTGIIATGIKAGKCGEAAVREITESMATLNRRASEIMLSVGVSTATDITGFGLIGHLSEVLSASRCKARLYTGNIPFFSDAVQLASLGIVPGGARTNLQSYTPLTEWGSDVSDIEKLLVNDAQTSGGLLIFVPNARKSALVDALSAEGILAAHIGDVSEGTEDGKKIFVTRCP